MIILSHQARRLLVSRISWKMVSLLALFAAVEHVSSLVPAFGMKWVIDRALPSRDLGMLVSIALGMIIFTALNAVLDVRTSVLAARIREEMILELRVDVFTHLHQQPLAFFMSKEPGESLAPVLAHVDGVGALAMSLLTFVTRALAFLTSLGALIFLDWRLSVLSLIFLPGFILPIRRTGKRRREVTKRALELHTAFVGMLLEKVSASGALLLKVFGRERDEAARLRKHAEALRNTNIEQARAQRMYPAFVGFIEVLGLSILFSVGGWLVIEGDLALGTLIASAAVLRGLYPPATAMAGALVDVIAGSPHLEHVAELLSMEPAIRDRPDATALVEVMGGLEFRDVHFSYGEAAPALNGVSISIAPGTRVALVGPSGAGKSTLVGLVARLHDPERGEVLLDGRDLRSIQLDSLRARIGVVTQETILFNDTILQNLRYGRPEASLEEVERAAKSAQLEEVIAALPDGYQTKVGEGGHRLSGGERQRLAIARAILRNPEILILDEATSALDSENEALIQRALDELLQGRTSLAIAHRLSTIQKADLILVMAEGRVVEQGSHRELLDLGGRYSRLRQAQSRSA